MKQVERAESLENLRTLLRKLRASGQLEALVGRLGDPQGGGGGERRQAGTSTTRGGGAAGRASASGQKRWVPGSTAGAAAAGGASKKHRTGGSGNRGGGLVRQTQERPVSLAAAGAGAEIARGTAPLATPGACVPHSAGPAGTEGGLQEAHDPCTQAAPAAMPSATPEEPALPKTEHGRQHAGQRSEGAGAPEHAAPACVEPAGEASPPAATNVAHAAAGRSAATARAGAPVRSAPAVVLPAREPCPAAAAAGPAEPSPGAAAAPPAVAVPPVTPVAEPAVPCSTPAGVPSPANAALPASAGQMGSHMLLLEQLVAAGSQPELLPQAGAGTAGAGAGPVGAGAGGHAAPAGPEGHVGGGGNHHAGCGVQPWPVIRPGRNRHITRLCMQEARLSLDSFQQSVHQRSCVFCCVSVLSSAFCNFLPHHAS